MIAEDEYDIEIWPPRQIGGQQAGAGPRGVKVTHKETGITVCVGHERSQHKNKLVALDALAGALTSPYFRR